MTCILPGGGGGLGDALLLLQPDGDLLSVISYSWEGTGDGGEREGDKGALLQREGGLQHLHFPRAQVTFPQLI